MEQSSNKRENKIKLTQTAFFQNFMPFIGLLTMMLLFGLITGFRSLSAHNLKLILEQSYVWLICATGVFFIMTMGGLDFSQGSAIGVASIVVATVAESSLILGIVLGIVVGAVIGAVNGVLHVKAKIGSFIVTICTMLIFRGVCAFLTTEAPVSAPIYMLGLNKWYICVPMVLVVVALGLFAFTQTKFGRNIRAIGAGETAARFSGIKVEKTKFLVFVLAGALAGFAATINTIRVGSITASAGSLLETNLMIALVLGGMPVSGGSKTKFSSVIAGVFMLAVLNNGLVMLQIDPNIQQLIKGIVFLTIVALTMDRKSAVVIK